MTRNIPFICARKMSNSNSQQSFMQKSKLLLYPGILLLLSSMMFQVGCQQEQLFDNQSPTAIDRIDHQGSSIQGEYLVILDNEAASRSGIQTFIPSSAREVDDMAKIRSIKDDLDQRSQLLRKEGGNILSEHGLSSKAINKVFSGSTLGMSVRLSEEDAKVLEDDPRIASVEPNRVIALGSSALIRTPFRPSDGKKGKQEVPYGTKLVGGSVNMSNSSRRAWIIDTGIDLDHEDLNVDASVGANFTSESSMDDGHGHGTHVAGIVGAINNGIGSLGVAAGAKVVPVKVLDNQGYGTTEDVLEGLVYVASMANRGDVVNISLGGERSNAIDQAVMNIANQGIRVIIAAGNTYEDANVVSPAGVSGNRIYTVAAIGKNKKFAYFSNFGSDVDYLAPGIDIFSTYKDNSYGYYSGTSMAAPHVAGLYLIGGEIETDDDNEIRMPDGRKRGIPTRDD